jgi:mitotic spindle assembly checkpoint protein MAD2
MSKSNKNTRTTATNKKLTACKQQRYNYTTASPMSATDIKTEITLKGSVDIVSEFFFTAINSILYQRGTIGKTAPNKIMVVKRRHLILIVPSIFIALPNTGIYQPETFKRESKYGLTVLTSSDEGLLKYLAQVMAQVEAWLLSGDVQRLVVVVSGVDSGETLERWQFNVSLEGNEDGENAKPNMTNPSGSKIGNKTMKEIHGEIQAIIRQITASVTFLPLLNEPCSFDLLVYTKKDAAVPAKWEDSDPCYIMNSQEVKLRSFTTSVSLETQTRGDYHQGLSNRSFTFSKFNFSYVSNAGPQGRFDGCLSRSR